MRTEQAYNTRVQPRIIFPITKQKIEQDQLWDKDKVDYYRNQQNFYNNNYWGFGTFGTQTNLDPHTQQEAIQNTLDYSKLNAGVLATSMATEGLASLLIPVKIGSGAEAVVYSSRLSPRVIKLTTIPRSEMHIRNTIPGALKSSLKGESNGLLKYTQPKIKILTKDQLQKAQGKISNYMAKHSWKEVTHPNLEGTGYTNGRWVISDLGEGNVGKDWLGRIRFSDFVVESRPQFNLYIRKLGGKLLTNFNRNKFRTSK